MVGGGKEVRSVDRRFRRAVLKRLAAVEAMAARVDATLSAPLARKHIKTIAGGWRELLTQHQPDSTGRCPVCSGWLRRRRWPCEVWVTAHRHLIGDNTDLIERLPRNSNPFCQPRQVVVLPRQVSARVAGQAEAGTSIWQSERDKASARQG
jgi:hypothetical protein